jgi:hypothetical protein
LFRRFVTITALVCVGTILGGAVLELMLDDGGNEIVDKGDKPRRKPPTRMPLAGNATRHAYPLADMRFLDWANGTWENNVRDAFQVDRLQQGYRFQCNFAAGYEQRMIAFPKEDPNRRTLMATFKVKSGKCELSIRPVNLAPRGARVSKEFQPGETYRVELGIRDGEAIATLNGQPVEVSQDSEGNGIFAIVVTRTCDVVFEDLRFVDCQ